MSISTSSCLKDVGEGSQDMGLSSPVQTGVVGHHIATYMVRQLETVPKVPPAWVSRQVIHLLGELTTKGLLMPKTGCICASLTWRF